MATQAALPRLLYDGNHFYSSQDPPVVIPLRVRDLRGIGFVDATLPSDQVDNHARARKAYVVVVPIGKAAVEGSDYHGKFLLYKPNSIARGLLKKLIEANSPKTGQSENQSVPQPATVPSVPISPSVAPQVQQPSNFYHLAYEGGVMLRDLTGKPIGLEGISQEGFIPIGTLPRQVFDGGAYRDRTRDEVLAYANRVNAGAIATTDGIKGHLSSRLKSVYLFFRLSEPAAKNLSRRESGIARF